MATMQVPAEVKSSSIRAVVTRADGTVEDLGEISYWHKHWWMRALHRMKRIIRW